MVDEDFFRRAIDEATNERQIIDGMGLFGDWLDEQCDPRYRGYQWAFWNQVCPVKSVSGLHAGVSYDWWFYPIKSPFIARHPLIAGSILPEELFKKLTYTAGKNSVVADLHPTKVNFREYETRQAAEEALCRAIQDASEENLAAWSAWLSELRKGVKSS